MHSHQECYLYVWHILVRNVFMWLTVVMIAYRYLDAMAHSFISGVNMGMVMVHWTARGVVVLVVMAPYTYLMPAIVGYRHFDRMVHLFVNGALGVAVMVSSMRHRTCK